MKKICNVSDVYKSNLCNSCGICKAVCNVHAISYENDAYGFLKPKVSDECINCKKCLKGCPGYNYYIDEDSKIQDYKILHSTNDEIRRNASSGGFVTELLLYLLRDNIVDYCIVIPTVKDLFKVTPVITNDINMIKEAKGSKYIPVQYGDVLNEIKESISKYAMVVLPCQEYAIKRYLGKNADRVMFITLMCNHMSGAKASANLVNQNGYRKSFKKIIYRGNGWPGSMEINNKDIGTFREIYGGAFGRYYFLYRCKMCDNHFGRNSAITVADPYFMDNNGVGNTFCIIRDSKVLKWIKEMQNEGCIEQVNYVVSDEDIKRGYKGIRDSEEYIPKLLSIRKRFFKAVPVNSEKYISKSNRMVCITDVRVYFSFFKDRLMGRLISWLSRLKRGSK